MYLVENSHPAIISRAIFHRTQEELARRKALRPKSDKTSITQSGKYSKYALSEVLLCAECGSRYKRVTWNIRGKKKIVWRCVSRLDYGKKYCKDSVTVEEAALHGAGVRALNRFHAEDESTYLTLMKATIGEAIGINGGSEEIDLLTRRIDALNKRMLDLVNETVAAGKDVDSSEDEFKDFYRKVFMDYKEPLFWIHLNMDYPFNLKGILYFPKINTEYDSVEGTIKLYNNQVFIADNIKEVIPEFLMLLKGVIDCPDLPLNVSRSALQNDGTVKKISEYISKKVADKLTGMCKTDRENYEKYWDDISPFIKYGCIKDAKFAEKMGDYVLFKNLDGKYLTLKDCIEENKKETEEIETQTEEKQKDATESENKDNAEEKEPEKTVIFYVTDEVQQSQYINMFKEAGKDAVILKHNIDSAFISSLEQKHQDVQFKRIDADLTEEMKGEGATDEETVKALTELFRKSLNKDKLEVHVENLKNENISAMVTLSEESRRMQDMMKMYNMYGMDPNMFGGQETLILNANHPLVKYLAENQESDKTSLICEQLYDLAMMSHKQLSPEEMTRFVQRSNEILLLITK